MVACGADHTVAVDDKGDVYSWGVGNYGNLGHGSTADQFRPKAIERLKGMLVISIACGAKHTLCCTRKGDVYAWGHGDNGRLGNGQKRGSLLPELLECLQGQKASFVAAGEAHSACITSTGSLYTWGAASYGRLGLGHGEETDMDTAQVVEALAREQIAVVACGAFHTLACTVGGDLFAWGGGLYGKLGVGPGDDRFVPPAIQLLASSPISALLR